MTARIIRAVQVPKPADLVSVTHIVRDTAEAIDIEASVFAVLAHDIAHFEDGFLVLVHFSVHIPPVQRVLVCDLKVAKSEVHGDCDLHLPALRKVVKQTRPHVHLELVEVELTFHLAFLIFDWDGCAHSKHLDFVCCRLHKAVDLLVAL